jgi:hypothetical protein
MRGGKNMDALKLMKLKKEYTSFKERHPKFIKFIKAQKTFLCEDSVIEITVTNPDGKTISSSIKVNDKDMDLLKNL